MEIMWIFLWEDKRIQTKYKQDTGKHPYLYCCQPFSLNIKILVNNIFSDQVSLVDLPKFGDDNVDDVDEYKMDRWQWRWQWRQTEDNNNDSDNDNEYGNVTFGELVVTLLKMLMRTRKSVIKRAIRPGTMSGGIRKEIQETT